MTPKIKNIIIFTVVAVVLILIYIFFIKKAPEKATLVATSPNATLPSSNTSPQDPSITKDFLSLLLNVKSIKLNNAIFSDIAFTSLRDSSIVLVPDGTEGRPNPFAPIGSDNVAPPVNNTNNSGVTTN